jgi:hypothetical protein
MDSFGLTRGAADLRLYCLPKWTMTGNASKTLESFDRLDPVEQHSVVVSLLRRAGELPSASLTDDDRCGIVDDLFSSLDDEENGNTYSEAR